MEVLPEDGVPPDVLLVAEGEFLERLAKLAHLFLHGRQPLPRELLAHLLEVGAGILLLL